MGALYIHIPFCASKCHYCDFYSRKPDSGDVITRYINAVVKEWAMRKDEITGTPRTIYIGGGTPSLMSAQQLAHLIEAIRPDSTLREFTIEANPEDITETWVNDIRRLGIDRVSIGVQSLIDEELASVGRRHTARRALQAIGLLQEGGITNISGDLIYGLPGQTVESWHHSVTRLLATGITHLSAYSLTYEPGSRLYAKLMSGKITETDDDTAASMYDILTEETGHRGWEHYEISNFAAPGFRAIHNSGYWDFTPYVGLGPGAHSFDGTVRRSNRPDLRRYLEAIESGNLFYDTEEETQSDLINDYIITRLRTVEGLDTADMGARFGSAAAGELKHAATRFINRGSLICDGDILRFPESGWLISDAVLRELLV